MAVSLTVLPLRRPNRLKPWIDRTDASTTILEAEEQIEELRRECWRTITQRLSALPAARANTFVTAILSTLLDGAPKQCLIAILLAIDLAAEELSEEAEAERIR